MSILAFSASVELAFEWAARARKDAQREIDGGKEWEAHSVAREGKKREREME